MDGAFVKEFMTKLKRIETTIAKQLKCFVLTTVFLYCLFYCVLGYLEIDNKRRMWQVGLFQRHEGPYNHCLQIQAKGKCQHGIHIKCQEIETRRWIILNMDFNIEEMCLDASHHNKDSYSHSFTCEPLRSNCYQFGKSNF